MVVSLWKVNDDPTAQIVESFYQNLAKGMDKAMALQKAKQTLIEEASTSFEAHPAFWSPFIQIGNHRSIKLL